MLNEGSTDEAFKKGFFDPAVPTLQFYDSELVVAAGKEHLEHMKLSTKTENRRIFAKCCGTPIGISTDHSHMNLVYSNLIKPTKDGECGENEVPFPTTVIGQFGVCLHAENLGAFPEEYKKKHPTMKIIPTTVAPVEIIKILSRLALLIGMGARGPGEGFALGSEKEIGYGYESIPKQMKKD